MNQDLFDPVVTIDDSLNVCVVWVDFTEALLAEGPAPFRESGILPIVT
jgi:hypothetical protein